MNASDAARKLYPPQDGVIPGVDRNEAARYAFLRGVEWQIGEDAAEVHAAETAEPVVHQAVSAQPATVHPDLVVIATLAEQIEGLRPTKYVWRGDQEDWERQGYEAALDEVLALVRAQPDQIAQLREQIRQMRGGRTVWPIGQERPGEPPAVSTQFSYRDNGLEQVQLTREEILFLQSENEAPPGKDVPLRTMFTPRSVRDEIRRRMAEGG